MARLREEIGYQITQPVRWAVHQEATAGKEQIQIYEDRGSGYQEETSYFVKDAERAEQYVSFQLQIDGNVKNLRIDPMMDYCVVRVHALLWNGMQLDAANRRIAVYNGVLSQAGRKGKPSIVFPTTDPNLNLRLERLERLEQNELCVTLEIIRISERMAQDLAGRSRLFH